ncbi:MAG: serine hydrolase [Flavobacteriia bacterium]|nr:serine hydrolase [Flavobacteriia bacterium]
MKNSILILSLVKCLFFFSQEFPINLNDYLIQNHIPGISILIIKNGTPIWSANHGYLNVDEQIPVQNGSNFMLASVSKTITSVALMNEFENGSFQLDDPINNYLPFTVKIPNYVTQEITFKHLLTHTSSIEDNWDVLSTYYVQGDSPISLSSYLQNYLTISGDNYNAVDNFHNNAPGTYSDYSNVGSALCGLLVESITSIPFHQYCKDSIFTPLCMENTSWFLNGMNLEQLALPYYFENNEFISYGHYGYPDYPDGQLRSNAIELGRFLTMFMNNGKYQNSRILDSSTVDKMKTVYFPNLDPTQGLIWYKNISNGKTLWGHNGGDDGVSTDMYFNETDSVGIILLTNGELEDSQPLIDSLFEFAELFEVQNHNSYPCGNILFYTPIYQNTTDKIKIFPNPFSEQLFIQKNNQDSMNMSIHSLDGKTILNETFNEELKILNLGNFSNGIYSLIIKSKENTEIFKIVIE